MNKPAFDPTKEYEAINDVEGEKPQFDPNKPYEEATEEQPGFLSDLGTAAKSTLFGFQKGASLGFSPQIVGAGTAAKEAITGNIKSYQDLLNAYRQGKKGQEQVESEAGQAAPLAYGAGQLTGSMVVPNLPGKAGTAIAAGLGGVMGANEAPEGSKVKGALIGATTQGVGQGLMNVIPKAEKLAGESAFLSMKPNKSEIKGLQFKGQTPEKVGQELLDKKILSGSVPDMLEKTEAAKSETGKAIGDLLNKIDTTYQGMKTKVTGDDIVNSLQNLKGKFEDSLAYSSSETNALDEKIQKIAKKYAGKEIPYTEVNSLITDFSKAIRNFGKENIGSQDVLRQGRSAIKNTMDNKLDEVASRMEELGMPEVQQLRDAKASYSKLSTAHEILNDTHSGDMSKKLIDRIDMGLGLGAGYGAEHFLHNPIEATAVGLGTVAASKLAGKYGNPITAKAADYIAKLPPDLREVYTYALTRGQKGIAIKDWIENMMNKKKEEQ